MNAEPLTENETRRRTWGGVDRKLDDLMLLERGWDRAGAAPISHALIASVKRLIAALQHGVEPFQDSYTISGLGREIEPPHDVYALSEGAIVIEWQFGGKDRRVDHIFIDEPGIATLMVLSDSTPLEVFDVTWPDDEFLIPKVNIVPSGNDGITDDPLSSDSFSLAM